MEFDNNKKHGLCGFNEFGFITISIFLGPIIHDMEKKNHILVDMVLPLELKKVLINPQSTFVIEIKKFNY